MNKDNPLYLHHLRLNGQNPGLKDKIMTFKETITFRGQRYSITGLWNVNRRSLEIHRTEIHRQVDGVDQLEEYSEAFHHEVINNTGFVNGVKGALLKRLRHG